MCVHVRGCVYVCVFVQVGVCVWMGWTGFSELLFVPLEESVATGMG